ncbi:MAG: hypothetical protein BIFFINMI_02018 [Phycisphaerae bacterium]|nr:hypothetical protein [Phycisphaerae bacterium]
MTDFDAWLTDHQVAWRRRNVRDQRMGKQNGLERPWILPAALWAEGLWPGIRESLPAYLDEKHVEKHKGVHNLKSSWMLCANLYFPFREPGGLELLAGFLRDRVSPLLQAVEGVELEYEEAPPLDPRTLLGEPAGGVRGANQTSPDVAFIVRTSAGRGLILTENKLVEHSFYPCAGRKSSVQNPDGNRCLDWPAVQADPAGQCWQMQWETPTRPNRRYWELIRLADHAPRTLTQCPAATGGYQLFRQQALAEGIAASGRYELVASCVAFDGRNDTLVGCLRGAGVDNFATGWGDLFAGRTLFRTWTHEQWVNWVQSHDPNGCWHNWISYLRDRYGY